MSRSDSSRRLRRADPTCHLVAGPRAPGPRAPLPAGSHAATNTHRQHLAVPTDPPTPWQEEEKEDDILSSCAKGVVSGLLFEALEDHVGEGIFTISRDAGDEIEDEDLVDEVTSKLGFGMKVPLDQESIETSLQDQDVGEEDEDDYEEVHSLVSDDEWEEQDRAEQAQSCLFKALSFAQAALRGPTAAVQEEEEAAKASARHALQAALDGPNKEETKAPVASVVAKTVAHEEEEAAKASARSALQAALDMPTKEAEEAAKASARHALQAALDMFNKEETKAPVASVVSKTAMEVPAPAAKDEAARQRPQPLEEQAPTAATLSVPPAAQATIVERHPAAPLSPASPSSLTKKARRTIFGGVVRAPKSEEVSSMGGRGLAAPSPDAGQSSPTWATALRVPAEAASGSVAAASNTPQVRRSLAAPAPSAMALDLGDPESPAPPRGGRTGSSAFSSESSSSFSRNFSNFTKKTAQVEFKFSQKSASSFAPMPPPQGIPKGSKDNGFLPALAGKSVPAGSVAWSVRMAKVGMSSWDAPLGGIF